jgi:3D (Asp-Asp-Asp) domain-containing protein
MRRLKWNRLLVSASLLIPAVTSILMVLLLLLLAVSHLPFEKEHTVAAATHAKPATHSKLTKTGIFTAYTSHRSQTDRHPHKTADGTDLRRESSCVVANNKIPMGTKVEIEGFGICEVRDRLRSRSAANRFDIYMGRDLHRAKEFGKRRLPYRIVHN